MTILFFIHPITYRGGSYIFKIIAFQDFETKFLPFIGFGCVGVDLGPDPEPRIRGATDVTCNENSVTFTVRTQRPMAGLMYAQRYHDDTKCVKAGFSLFHP